MLSTLQDFIYDEARLIDSADYEAWLALFAEDGRYWVPLKGQAQTEDERHNAIADESPLLLRLRVARLRGDGVLERIPVQLASDRRARDLQHAAEIALHQHADGPATQRCRQPARRRADAALPAEAAHAGAGTDGSLREGAARPRSLECVAHVVERHVHRARV